jgi:hypothetical protein
MALLGNEQETISRLDMLIGDACDSTSAGSLVIWFSGVLGRGSVTIESPTWPALEISAMKLVRSHVLFMRGNRLSI